MRRPPSAVHPIASPGSSSSATSTFASGVNGAGSQPITVDKPLQRNPAAGLISAHGDPRKAHAPAFACYIEGKRLVNDELKPASA